ncbi:MAG: Asp-tRNA(Asn)/Glu-tRNA(Gln) amidotransferase subunit GatC [Candidatus Glassbacteria bacterium]
MDISLEEVKKIAHLARLHMVEEELRSLAHDLNQILIFLEKLSKLESSQTGSELEITGSQIDLRPDRPLDSSRAEGIRSAACSPLDTYFSVPGVMEKNEPPGNS